MMELASAKLPACDEWRLPNGLRKFLVLKMRRRCWGGVAHEWTVMSARPPDGGGFILCNRLTSGNLPRRAGLFVGDVWLEALFSCRDCKKKIEMKIWGVNDTDYDMVWVLQHFYCCSLSLYAPSKYEITFIWMKRISSSRHDSLL